MFREGRLQECLEKDQYDNVQRRKNTKMFRVARI